MRIQTAGALVGALSLLSSVAAWAAVGRIEGVSSVGDTGAAAYVVPIQVPVATGGLAPQLAFSYSSRAEAGPVGVGWGISGLSRIELCPSTWASNGAPRNVRGDAGDRFCLDGVQLKYVSGPSYGGSGTQYATELESFSRILSFGAAGAGPASFTVERKDGLIYEYGNSEDSRIEVLGVSTARVWAINKIRDRYGNAVLFNYTQDAMNGSYRISTIQYASNALQGVSAPYQVAFIYESLPLNEVDMGFMAGGMIRRVTRLDRVDITHLGSLVRRYELAYEPNLSSTSRSRLQSIQACAGTPSLDCLSPTSFTYQNGTASLSAGVNTAVTSGSLVSFPIDVNGDGRTDVVYSSTAVSGAGVWMYALANSNGTYTTPASTGIVNTNYDQAIPIDYNADGREDLLVPYSGGTWWVLPGTASGLAAPINTGIAAAGANLNARAMDVNGDGLDDLVWADFTPGSHSIRYRLRELAGSFSAGVSFLFQATGADLNATIAGPVFGSSQFRSRQRLPDFDGDGRKDFLLKLQFGTGPAAAYTWRLIRTGGAPISMSVTPESFAANPLFLDLNDDELSDVVYVAGGTWRYRFSRGTVLGVEVIGPDPASADSANAIALDWDSDGFEDIVSRNTTTNALQVMRSSGELLLSNLSTGVAVAEPGAFFTVDVNGDGLDDVLHLGQSAKTFVQFRHAGTAPDLLQSATDGFGVNATFSYAPLSNYALYQRKSTAIYPMQEYSRPLYVVSNVRSSNGVGGTFDLRDFSYEGARVDLQGRGFLGFEYRSWIDSRVGTAQRVTYRQDFPFTGLLSNQKSTQEPSGTVIGEVQLTFAQHAYSSGIETRRLPYVSQSVQYDREAGGAYNGVLVRTTTTINAVDAPSGSVRESVTTLSEGAGANGVNPGQSYTYRTHSPTLFNDFPSWCIGRASTIQQTNSHTLYGGSAQTRTANTTWDAAKCRPTQTVVEPDDPALRVTTEFGYDAFGNLASQTLTAGGIAARVTQLSWGSDGRFPRTLTNPLSQVTTLDWWPALGQLKSATDPNGLVSTSTYDVFGRLTQQTQPDGTSSLVEYLPCDADCTGFTNTRFKIRSTLRDTTLATIAQSFTLFDSLGRPRRSANYALEGGLISQLTEYNARGLVARTSVPYFNLIGTPVWTTFSYDLLGRQQQVTRERTSDNDASAASSTTQYDGLSVTSTDPLGKVRVDTLDPLGQIVRAIQASGGVYQTQTSYDYDAFGSLVRTTDADGNQITIGYNIRGFKVSSSDPDLGNWTYDYNALGEITRQTDARSQIASYTYDKLSRPLTRVEPADSGSGTQTTTWAWGASTAAFNIGQLQSISLGSYSESYTYDNRARLTNTTVVADGGTYVLGRSYSAVTGLLETITYPASTGASPFKVKYEFDTANKSGLLKRIKDFNAGTVFWQGVSSNALGQYQDVTLGNGLKTLTAFDSITGAINRIETGVGGGTAQQSLQYARDKVGNLTSRQDLNIGKTETFAYDDLYRMVLAQVGGGSFINVSYDPIGNIRSKSDLGIYTYHPTKKHAVTSAGPLNFTYDANGNLSTQTGAGFSAIVNWTAYNLPKSIADASGFSSQFLYGPDRQRYKHVAVSPGVTETTIYVKGILERLTRSSGTEYKHSIFGPDGVVAIHNRRSSGTNETIYLLKDHLGSTDVITNAAGATVLKLSFDAFGNRRDANTWAAVPSVADYTLISNTSRLGFTGHEQIDNLDLVHMNGRVYHPRIARFGSPDPFVQAPFNSQSLNRYSYVFNNPLTFTDPSGFFAGEDGGTRYQAPRETADRDSGGSGGPGFGVCSRCGGPGRQPASQPGGSTVPLPPVTDTPIPVVPTVPVSDPVVPTPGPTVPDVPPTTGPIVPTPAAPTGVQVQSSAGDGWMLASAVGGGVAAAIRANRLRALIEGTKLLGFEVSAVVGATVSAPFLLLYSADAGPADEFPNGYAPPPCGARGIVCNENSKGEVPPGSGPLDIGGGVTPGDPNQFDPDKQEPLKPIHAPAQIRNSSSYRFLSKQSTEDLIRSLRPGQREALRVTSDGRIFNGNTRITILQERGVDVNALPRELYVPGGIPGL